VKSTSIWRIQVGESKVWFKAFMTNSHRAKVKNYYYYFYFFFEKSAEKNQKSKMTEINSAKFDGQKKQNPI